METVILCRYGELAIKGGNRSAFERCLRQNIRRMLSVNNINARLSVKRGRTFVHLADQSQQSAALAILQRVFGLSSISPALTVDCDYPAIEEAAERLLAGKSFSTFRVTAQRLVKTFDPSLEIQRKLGRFIETTFGKKVSLTSADIDIGIEIADRAYLFTERLIAPGGLPVGIEGTVIAIMENPSDLLAAWLVMKRGCAIIPVQRKPFPITPLERHGCENALIAINHIKEITGIAKQHSAQAVVVGQTLADLMPLELQLPVLRPLVGYSTVHINEKIEDLCTPLSKK